MTPTDPAALDRDRAQSRLGLLGFWCALWLVIGVWVGYEVWQMSELASTVADSGRALGAAGSALESLGNVPLVGDTTAELGQKVTANSADIVGSAAVADGSIRRLSVLLGFTIAVIPTVPVVVMHRALGHRAPVAAEG